jgi:hypothetical protein
MGGKTIGIFLYYFITAPFNEAPLIPNYKNRYENILSMNLNDSDLNFQNISGNLQKKQSAFFQVRNNSTIIN